MFRSMLAAVVVVVLGFSPAVAGHLTGNKGHGSGSGGSGEFLGFTGAITDAGVGGIAGMNALCEAEFGDNARFCTTEEFMRSGSQGVPSSAAWIHPVLNFVQVAAIPGTLFSFMCVADTGQNSARKLIWSSDDPADNGTVVDTDGRVAVATAAVVTEDFTCDVARPVACCARRPL